MNVYLNDAVVIDNHHAVTDAFEIRAQFCRVVAAVALVHYVFGAVGEFDVRFVCTRGVLADERYLTLLFGSFEVFDDTLALYDAVNTFEDQQESHCAGIHDSRLFKSRQQFRGARQRFLARFDQRGEYLQRVVRFLRLFHGSLGSLAGNRQHSTLRGLHNGLVSCSNAICQRGSEFASGSRGLSAQPL